VNILEAIILGIIQGITEWLPVSSSGHLVIAQESMGIEAPLFFDAMVHVGTLIVVIWVFRREVLNVLRALVEIIGDILKGVPFTETLKENEHHLAYLIVIGTIPTTIIGLTFRGPLESMYSNLLAVGIGLVANGFYLYFTKYFVIEKANGNDKKSILRSNRIGIKQMTAKEALLIGTMQGVAIIPGVSRSGSTISTGIYTGLDKELVTRYSFLLFMPAILGAAILQTGTVISRGESIEWIPTIVGTATAMIVSYFAIRILLEVIRKSRLHLFSSYCWIVGIIVIINAVLF